MKFIKMLLKATLALILVCVLAGIGFYFYNEYEHEQELSYSTEDEWFWHQKESGIQIQEVMPGKSVLRKVNLKDNYVVYAHKNEDYSIVSTAKFLVSCTANTKIETPEKFSDGKSKVLECNGEGDALFYSVSWPQGSDDFLWAESLGGFSVREHFSLWDFRALDQEVTLLKAK